MHTDSVSHGDRIASVSSLSPLRDTSLINLFDFNCRRGRATDSQGEGIQYALVH